jgi:hypothetical protein
MTLMEVEAAEKAAERWRTVAGPDNPAGPLYLSGAFAEPDIVEAPAAITGDIRCSACTRSANIECC